jgi:hypothetical protein
MAMKINGPDARLSPKDFLTAARTIGLLQGRAEAVLHDLPPRVLGRVATLELPEIAATPGARDALARMASIVEERVAALK